MPARTYSTDVYLTCPCPDCEGRKARITLSKFRSHSRLPSPACEQPAGVRTRQPVVARPNQVAPTDRQTPSRRLGCQ
jgi:hypothetical protein